MRKQVSRRTVLLLVVGSMLAALMLTGIASTRRTTTTGQTERNADARSLNESNKAAAVNSVASQAASAPSDTQSVTADLVNRSSVIVVATALFNKSRLAPNGEEVRTYYKVRVNEVLKGHVRAGSTIEASMLGGLVLLKGDGSEVDENNRLKGEASVRVQVTDDRMPDGRVPLDGVASTKFTPPEFTQPMVNGQTYVIFLQEKSKANGLSMIAEPQKAENAQPLIEEIRAAVQQQ